MPVRAALLATLATALVPLPAAAAADGMAGMAMPARRFAAGAPGDPARPARLVAVTMRERDDGRMDFAPARIEVRAGEQVRFRITNAGRADHEFLLDTVARNAAHKAMMEAHPGMAHAEGNGRTVAPGATAELLWRFGRPGTYEYACLIPGHYEAGMHATLAVR